MLSFAIRRILQSVPTVLAVVLVIFVLFSVVPGNRSSMSDDGRGTVDAAGRGAHAQAARPRRSGLRALRQLRRQARGARSRDFVPDARAGLAMLAKRLWPTLQLVIRRHGVCDRDRRAARFLAAMRPGSSIDAISMFVAVSGLSIAKFWLGLLLMYLFALKLGWLPTFGYGDGGLDISSCRRSRSVSRRWRCSRGRRAPRFSRS